LPHHRDLVDWGLSALLTSIPWIGLTSVVTVVMGLVFSSVKCPRKRNAAIPVKFPKGNHESAWHIRAVEKWAARFRGGQNSIQDEARPEKPLETDFRNAVVRFLEKQSHSSSWEMSKALCWPKTAVLRGLDDLGLHFLAPRRIPYHLPEPYKAERVQVCEDTLQIIKSLGLQYHKYLLTGNES
jgi:hypothetical protein